MRRAGTPLNLPATRPVAGVTSAILYCRAGFEGECGEEFVRLAQAMDVPGSCVPMAGGGGVRFRPDAPDLLPELARELPFQDLVFARQVIFVAEPLRKLPAGDRVAPLVDAARRLGGRFGELFIETLDTDAAKQQLALAGHLAEPLREAALAQKLVSASPDARRPRLHVLLEQGDCAWVGYSMPGHSAPWFMGIPRLGTGARAASRSALKLAEAFLVFLGPRQAEVLRPGSRAVDLGAAPGGWSLELAQRGLLVTAVDNGSLDPAVLDTGLVEHVRHDGYTFRPERPVEWLVCDMAQPPRRVAGLVATWLANGWARHAVFNLKLPMKRRLEEVSRCEAVITQTLARTTDAFHLRMRQLYHDREEVTAYLWREVVRSTSRVPRARSRSRR